MVKKTSETALLPLEAEEAAQLLGAKIRAARKARVWTQAELAQRTEMSLNTVIKMESGHVAVQLGFYLKALWALDLIHDLLQQLGQVGINAAEFALLESGMPQRVREKRSRP